MYMRRTLFVHHSSQMVDTTGPETTASPTLPPSSSVTISPVSRSRFQITTVLLFWCPTASRSPASFSENWRGNQPPEGAFWRNVSVPSSLIVQVVRVSDGLDRYRAEVEKDDSRVETMRNFWSGYLITGLVS